MRLIGSFQTITIHGRSGVTSSSVSGSWTSAGAADTPLRLLRRVARRRWTNGRLTGKTSLGYGRILPRLLALAALALTLVTAENALAARAPTRAERTKIIAAVGARRCEVGRIRVSTVDSHWARFDYGYAGGHDPSDCSNVPTGMHFVHKRSGVW